jgi:uncharacterized protein YbjQ (UPF0145 family)
MGPPCPLSPIKVHSMSGLIQLVTFLLLLSIGYFVGQLREGKHYESIDRREKDLLAYPVVTLKRMPNVDPGTVPLLVTGSVCISIDYFKRFAGSLRNIFGGRVTAYETVIDRGRREAILRMREEALRSGYHGVICMRVETSRIASGRSDGKGTAGIEILAYGTAVRLIRRDGVT